VGGDNSASRSGPPRLVALGAPTPLAVELSAGRTTVGSGGGNDLRLNDSTVSRRHALLERRWGRWRVTDLGSTNGTYLNGRRVSTTWRAALKRGDELRFGNARFGFVRAGDDLSTVGARRRTPSRRRKTVSRAAGASAALLLFAAGFGATEYLMGVQRAARTGVSAAGVARPLGVATPAAAAMPRAASGAAAANAPPPGRVGAGGGRARLRPRCGQPKWIDAVVARSRERIPRDGEASAGRRRPGA
jgi:pSer/pThr/pTyr-binding forkhead associated (FHA) protein